MTVQEFPPARKLGRYVQLIWCLEVDAAADFGAPESIAPDGIGEVVFHYRDPMDSARVPAPHQFPQRLDWTTSGPLTRRMKLGGGAGRATSR